MLGENTSIFALMDKFCRFLSVVSVCFVFFEEPRAANQDAEWQPEGLVLKTKDASGMDVLISPLKERKSYLVDVDGVIVKEWESEYRVALASYLTPDGGLIRSGRLETNIPERFRKGGGRGGVLERFDSEGKKVWHFEYSSEEAILHHDFKLLSNGNVVAIAWAAVDLDAAAAAGRVDVGLFGHSLWYTRIIEIEPVYPEGGRIVWQWDSWDHIIQDADRNKPNFGRIARSPEKININYYRLPARSSNGGENEEILQRRRTEGLGIGRMDWMHANSIDYDEKTGYVLLSVHGFDEIWVVDRNAPEDGLAYRFGNPRPVYMDPRIDPFFYRQHDAQWVGGEGGELRILVFNNGSADSYHHYSSLVELTLPWSEDEGFRKSSNGSYAPPAIAWRYDGPEGLERSLFASRMSGTQRLPNGNTIYCDGPKGRIFEIAPYGTVAWEYWNPFGTFGPESSDPRHRSSTRPLFKVRFYPVSQ